MIKLRYIAPVLALFCATPALAATPSDVFNCKATRADSLKVMEAMTPADERSREIGETRMKAKSFLPGDIKIFGFTPSRLEYLREDSGFSLTESFSGYVTATQDEARKAVFGAKAASACTSSDATSCVAFTAGPQGKLKIETRGAVSKITCYYID